jgi:hypothetical protein
VTLAKDSHKAKEPLHRAFILGLLWFRQARKGTTSMRTGRIRSTGVCVQTFCRGGHLTARLRALGLSAFSLGSFEILRAAHGLETGHLTQEITQWFAVTGANQDKDTFAP